jgi:hypothetical protein
VSKGLKIFAGIGCGLVLIGAVGIVLFIIGLNVLESRLSESTRPFETEGREFGKRTGQQGCIDEGLRRAKSASFYEAGKGLETYIFVDACLETSGQTPGFCDGVPSYWSTKALEWKTAQCHKVGMDEQKTGCLHVFKAKHGRCGTAF